ncbi:MAG: NAD(P)/FAD-dependent oxidoreductase [Candidatus Cloacimonetes bacterium]|nr:NAD(P)/FAD-dependent oxidoreductase [Candidatus Cloacimonadota bacterium]
MAKYDVFVIGTGVAGTKIADACSTAGKKVGICDYREYGGTCGLRGCVPKKVLTSVAEAQIRLQGYKEKGIITGETLVNWENLIKFKETFTQDLPRDKERDLAEHDIDMYHGKAKFIDPHKLKIGDQIIETDIVVLATGAEPRIMNIPGEEYVITSAEFMNLPALPDSILFIGGGYISFELGQVANVVGAKVTILERSSRPLGTFEPELAQLLAQNFADSGIVIETETSVVSIKKQGNKFLVEAESGKVFITDMVVHGAGRVPRFQELELDKAGVKTDSHGIILNPHLQSISNSQVYVAGDAVSDPHSLPLTSIASLEAKIVIHNILNHDKKIPNYAGTASALFTFPPLARVGMLEADAKRHHIDYRVSFGDTSDLDSTKRLALKVSAYKIIIKKDDSTIIGAHLLGHHVDEVINLFALAIRNGLTVDDLKETIWSYPSVSDVLDDMLG